MRRITAVVALILVAAAAQAQSPAPVPFPYCRLSIEEVPAGDIGPDIGGFWVEDYVPPEIDLYVNIGVCGGVCLINTLTCIPTKFKPVRIENHGPDGVTPLRVYVPADCECKLHDGPVIVWYYVYPGLDGLLSGLVFVVVDVGMTTIIGTFPEGDRPKGAAFSSLAAERVAVVMSFTGAPAVFQQVNAGEVPLTTQLKADIETWLWVHLGEAIESSADDAGLSAEAKALVIEGLRSEFPRLWE